MTQLNRAGDTNFGAKNRKRRLHPGGEGERRNTSREKGFLLPLEKKSIILCLRRSEGIERVSRERGRLLLGGDRGEGS